MNMEAATPLLEIENLKLTLAQRDVLDIASIRIERGQIVMLSGDNGSGKTTLLKVLAGLLTARHGLFTCLGTRMAGPAAARFCRGRHIYLHQTPYMFDGTVEDNVAYGLKQRGRDHGQRRIEIRDALAWAELEHLVHRQARELSTGERQRVALTRAKILTPSLLLLDEITANMDSTSRQRTHTMVADLKRSGASVVLATHDHEALEALCDIRLDLAAGRLVHEQSYPADVIPLRRDVGAPDKH
jgi:tungstate transport system ATP-binding protein